MTTHLRKLVAYLLLLVCGAGLLVTTEAVAGDSHEAACAGSYDCPDSDDDSDDGSERHHCERHPCGFGHCPVRFDERVELAPMVATLVSMPSVRPLISDSHLQSLVEPPLDVA